ncbi:MAG TPA: DUF4129 domain-containing protein [Thermomicrobiales bacterium]|nr:DUF4129 domain-containing protein [Thermomicrobiales bacterium]
MRLARLAIVVVALALALPLAGSPVTAIDLDTYRAQLEAIDASLSGPNPDIDGALTILSAIEPVTLDDGSNVAPDLSRITTALEADPPDIASAQAGIDAILSALDLAGTDLASDPDAAVTALDEVLAREEFQPEPVEAESPSLWQRFLGWVNDIITSFFEWLNGLLGGSSGEGSPLSTALALLGVLVIVGIVAFAVRSVRESMTPGVTRLAEGSAEEHYTSAEARDEAERLFAAGDYRAALRMLYLATLIRWEEAGRLRFDRSLTNREVVARVTLHGDATLLAQLSPLVERFDRVWYGGASCTSNDYASFASLAERAWEAAP